jgi:hypothetical protein
MKRYVWFALMSVLFVISSNATAGHLWNVMPKWVMTGDSSAFGNGVWLGVHGQVAEASCYYAPYDVSLFYVKPGGGIDPAKALALLTTAKVSGDAVSFAYESNSVTADFWGYGISSCQVLRLTLH